jgi:hypothetical protein
MQLILDGSVSQQLLSNQDVQESKMQKAGILIKLLSE